MNGTPAVVEVETMVGSRGLHFRVREGNGSRRLLVEFDLDPAEAFAVFQGTVKRVVAKIGDLDQGRRITQLLDRMTSPDGEETQRSTEDLSTDIVLAFHAALSNDTDEQLRLALSEEMQG